jgi:hypothetical protein
LVSSLVPKKKSFINKTSGNRNFVGAKRVLAKTEEIFGRKNFGQTQGTA